MGNATVIEFLLVMFFVGIINTLWTYYIKFVGNNSPWRAAITGELIFVIGAFTTLGYVHKPILIMAATIGGFIGTFLTVKYLKDKV